MTAPPGDPAFEAAVAARVGPFLAQAREDLARCDAEGWPLSLRVLVLPDCPRPVPTGATAPTPWGPVEVYARPAGCVSCGAPCGEPWEHARCAPCAEAARRVVERVVVERAASRPAPPEPLPEAH